MLPIKIDGRLQIFDGLLGSDRSRTRAAAPPTDRPICYARVPQAIGQSFDWLAPAEAEVLDTRC